MKKALPILVGVLLAALTISTVVFSVELIRLKDEIAAIPARRKGHPDPRGRRVLPVQLEPAVGEGR